MVAIVAFDEDQVAQDVRSTGVRSPSTPEAENCFAVPRLILATDGDVVIDETNDVVNVTELVIPPNIAEIVAVPAVGPAVAMPFEPAALLTPAIVLSDEAQSARDVSICVALFARVPSAENCCVIPGARLCGVAGDSTSETVSDVVSRVDPVMPLYTAVMTAEPVNEPAVARPPELIVAMPVSDELHVTDDVRFCVPPFE
jgi:hypothetical protein